MTTIDDVLAVTAGRVPDNVAISFDGQPITYRELDADAARIAAGFAAAGVVPGDRVALWLPNHPAFAAAMYGAWRCGAVIVPIHAQLTQPEAKHILTDAEAKVLICGATQHATAGDALTKIASLERVLVLGEPSFDTFGADAPPAPGVALDDDALALVAYTAGTSGVPKGAMLTHGNLRANLAQMRGTPISVGPDDVTLCILPLFHIFGLNVVLNLAIDVGARVVLHQRFDPKASLDAIRSEGVTVISGAPPAYVEWLRLDGAAADSFESVRVAVSGAAPLAKETLAGFRDRFGVTIWEGYGLTETAPALTSTAIGGVAKPGSIGRPLPGVEIRLVEEGEDVEEGDPGEVFVRGPNVFRGYWGHPDETKEAFVDGWFRTGDVAVADHDGYLYLVDRRRDMVLVSGFNVYPREVEDVLRRHPHVGDVAVVGDTDVRSGESVRAIVVLDPPGESVSAEELIEFCRRSLAPYKVPATIEMVSEIPRNAAGKVLRRSLRH